MTLAKSLDDIADGSNVIMNYSGPNSYIGGVVAEHGVFFVFIKYPPANSSCQVYSGGKEEVITYIITQWHDVDNDQWEVEGDEALNLYTPILPDGTPSQWP